MIFVTVGTHEQPFDRLVEYIDSLKADGTLTEDVVIQTGYSTYAPKFCRWQKLFPYQEMIALIAEARIVITHGGPASFIMPLQIGKIPVVVPRQKQFDEHVNDHQLIFCREVAARQKNIITVEQIEDLRRILTGYPDIVARMDTAHNSNNQKFCQEFRLLAEDLLK